MLPRSQNRRNVFTIVICTTRVRTTLRVTGDLPFGHGSVSVSVGACLLGDGRVLRAGGMVFPNASAKAAIYDPSTEVWTATPDMNVPRGEYGDPVPLANGKVLV